MKPTLPYSTPIEVLLKWCISCILIWLYGKRLGFGGFKWVEVGLILKTRKWRYCWHNSTKNYKFKQNPPPFDKKGTEFPKNSLSDSTRTNILLLFFYIPTPYLTNSLRLRHSSQNIKRQNSSSSYIFPHILSQFPLILQQFLPK